jgi:acyl carrier protein
MATQSTMNPVERQVSAMLRELLQVDRVGVDDNLLLLSSDSRWGARLICRVKQRLEVELSPRDVSEARTVADLAAQIERRIQSQIESITERDVSIAINS